MPIDYKNEIFYSADELARILQVSREDVEDFARSQNFAKDNVASSQIHLAKQSLESFFEAYFTSRGQSKDRCYKIPDYLKNCSSPWAVELVKMYGKRVNFPASLSPEQGEFLKGLISNLNPNNIIEIGCFTGISTLWMAAGLEQIGSNATIHSIDLFDELLPWLPTRHGCLLDPFQSAQNSAIAAQLSHRIQFHKMNSIEAGKRVYEMVDQPVDFIFIDGDHTQGGCLADLMLFYPYVSVGGYIMLHDIYPDVCHWDGPRYVIDEYIKNNPHFELTEIKTSPCNFGMALIRKVSVDQNLCLPVKLLTTVNT